MKNKLHHFLSYLSALVWVGGIAFPLLYQFTPKIFFLFPVSIIATCLIWVCILFLVFKIRFIFLKISRSLFGVLFISPLVLFLSLVVAFVISALTYSTYSIVGNIFPFSDVNIPMAGGCDVLFASDRYLSGSKHGYFHDTSYDIYCYGTLSEKLCSKVSDQTGWMERAIIIDLFRPYDQVYPKWVLLTGNCSAIYRGTSSY